MSKYIVFVSKEHYNPLGIVRTLGEAGITPITVCVKGDLQMVGQSKYVKERYYVDSPEEGLEFILSNFADPNEKSFILTGDDVTVALMDRNYDRLKDYFYFYNAGENGRINYFMNKDTMLELVTRHGIKVAKTWKVKVGEIPEDIEYPIMTKAINSIGEEWKDIVYICQNDEELKDAYSKMKSEYILVQQYVKKTDEISFDAFSVNKGKDVFIVTEAYQMYNIPDKYSPFWRIENHANFELGEKIKSVIAEMGLEGIWEFEFMADDKGNLWFLEINFRNTALGYSTTVAGMPQIVMWCDAMKNGVIDHSKRVPVPEGLKAMAECFDYDVRVKGGWMTSEEWLAEYMPCACKMYMGRDDYEPFRIFMEYKQKHMR